MEQIENFALGTTFLILPLYFMLRFRLIGLIGSVLILWIAFSILSEFFPLSRPGWEPLHNPISFVFGLIFYLIPYLLIFGLKELLISLIKKNKRDEHPPA